MSTVNFNFFEKICNFLHFFWIFAYLMLFFHFFMNSCLFSGNFVKDPGIFGEIFSIFLRNFWGIMKVSGVNQGIFRVFWGIVWSFGDNFFGDWCESWNFLPRIWSLRESFFGIWSESWIFFAGIWTFVMRFDIFLMFYR